MNQKKHTFEQINNMQNKNNELNNKFIINVTNKQKNRIECY